MEWGLGRYLGGQERGVGDWEADGPGKVPAVVGG